MRLSLCYYRWTERHQSRRHSSKNLCTVSKNPGRGSDGDAGHPGEQKTQALLLVLTRQIRDTRFSQGLWSHHVLVSVLKRDRRWHVWHMDGKTLVHHAYYYQGNDSFVNIWGGETDFPPKCPLISFNRSVNLIFEFELTSSCCHCE